MRRHLAMLIVLVVAHVAAGQTGSDPAERHARILRSHRSDDHAAVVREVQQQIQAVEGTTWQDSVYRYVYILGKSVWRTKGADEGIAAAQQLVDITRQRDGNADHQLDALDGMARLLSGMGRLLECVRVDSIALAVADASGAVSLERKGRARHRLASDHVSMGDHERGLKYYKEAIAVYERTVPKLVALLGEAYNGAGSACWHMGRTREAEEYYERALGFFEKSTDARKDFRMAGTMINRGILWQGAGDLNRSKANYAESIRIFGAVADTATDPDVRDEAKLGRTRGYVNMATVYFALGDDGRSRAFLELALHDRKALLEPDDPKLLGVVDRLADVEMEAGNYAKAEEQVRSYVEACEKYFGKRSEDYIRACSKLARVQAALGRPQQADSLFALSIALHRTMESAATDPELAFALRQRAQFRVAQGHLPEAIADLLEARGIIERIHHPDHYGLAMYDLLLAEAALASDDPRSAHRYAQRALALVDDRASSIASARLPQAYPQPHLLPDALYYRILAERLMDSTEARADWIRDIDLGLLALARNKAAYDDEGSQLGLIGAQKDLFHLAVDVAFEEWERSPSEANLDRFLGYTEADRAILLKRRLNDIPGMRFAGVPDTVIERERQLIGALEVDPDDRAAAMEITAREEQLADFLDRLSKDHPEYFDLRYGEPRIGIEDLRVRLARPDQDILAYAVTNEHIHMLVVRADTAMLVQVPKDNLDEKVDALTTAIAQRDAGTFVDASYRTYRSVFEPVAALLRSPKLLIIPDGPLHRINFEVLVSQPQVKDYHKNMLIQRHAIGYLLSATTAVRFAGMQRVPIRTTLALAPGFSDELKRGYVARVRDTARVDRRFLDYVRQPFAMAMAEDLGDLVSAKVMVGEQASEQGFRKEADRYGILHLGTHAELNANAPLYSRLVLSKDGQGVDPDADGYLHAYEIYELDLRAQLAVLTACETGAGRSEDGEGVRSLGYGFAYAGCPSLVMSLWSIDEQVSSRIIKRFYELLADGLPKHEALRQAKLEHLNEASEELAAPYYWAGLVLVGDVEPVELGRSWTRYGWWILGVLVVLFIVYRWRRR